MSEDVDYGWKRLSALATTPAVDLALLKRHARLPLHAGYTDDDALLIRYLNSAEKLLEDQAETCLREKVWELWFSRMSGVNGCRVGTCCAPYYTGENFVRVRLERPPVTSVNSVKYYDKDDVLQTLDPAGYHLLADASPPLLIINRDALADISLSVNRLDVWRVNMTCGTNVTTGRLEPTAEVAMMLLAAYYFRHPEDDGKVPPTGSTEHRAFRDCLENLRWRMYP